MNFRDLALKSAYETSVDDLVWDFYIPVLSKARRYDRISGFFSSTSIALSARGLAGLIANGGTMRLITCPRLSEEDAAMMASSVTDPSVILSKSLISSLSDVSDSFEHDHIAAMGWMLAKGYLKIKIAIVKTKGSICSAQQSTAHSIMHQKVGILYDDESNGLSFSGSNNETASGWLENIEEFKVFRQWESGQSIYFEDDCAKFNSFWNNNCPGVEIVDLPTAVQEHLLIAGKSFEKETIALQRYYTKHRPLPSKPKQELKLFVYQNAAVEKWISNGHCLLFEMATGCGKTRTAIACMNTVLTNEKKSKVFVVTCPQSTLSLQWKADIEKLGIPFAVNVICDGNFANWRTTLSLQLKQVTAGMYSSLIIYTTHVTASSSDFIAMIKSANSLLRIIVADEVHGMGAAESRKGLLEEYQYRIGLSATPSRWFDPDGTELISNYFGNDSFVFTIRDALSTINLLTGKPFLVNFRYHPHFVSLTPDELEEYKRISEKISHMSHIHPNSEKGNPLQFLLFRRANMEKNAKNKYCALETILDQVGTDIANTIIFVSSEQIEKVMAILGKRGIPAHRYTEKQSTKVSKKWGGRSERQYIIDCFIKGDYKVLVAIKCLDEGIDIPSAMRAIVMASSTNPREYVQRIGRVIRQDRGKWDADIHDLILHPDLSGWTDSEFLKLEKRIFNKEMDRVIDLARNAMNNADAINLVFKIKEESL